MKNFHRSSILFGLAVFLMASPCYAQLGFSTYSSSYIGTDSVISFSLQFLWHVDDTFTTTYETFGGGPGVTTDPGGVSISRGQPDGSINVDVTVNLDSASYGGSNCTTVVVEGAPVPVYPAEIGIYRYNPNIKGRIRVSTDTVDFGSVSVGTLGFQNNFQVSIDTSGAIFRKLSVLHLQTPFDWNDTIAPDYFGDCPTPSGYYTNGPYFAPTEVGKYIDSVYIYDPIQNDSTILILLGEGVAAGVSETPVAAELRVYPNPADGATNVSLANNAIESVTVYNIVGNPVMEVPADGEGYLTLNIASVPSGIYYLEATSKEKVYREQVIVSH